MSESESSSNLYEKDLLNRHFSYLKGFKNGPRTKDTNSFMDIEDDKLHELYFKASCISNKLVDVVKKELNRELRWHELRYQHWMVLISLFLNEASSPGAIADQISIDRPSLTRLIDYLVIRELVSRTRSHIDRRTIKLALTDQGLHLAKIGLKLFENISKSFKEKLTADELNYVLLLEEKILDTSKE